MSSKAKLETPYGMNFHCNQSREFQDQGFWYRVEVAHQRDYKGNEFTAASYIRQGAYWKPYTNQRCAMERRALLKICEEVAT